VYLQAAGCRLNWPLAIKSTSLCIAPRSDKSTLRDFLQAPKRVFVAPPIRARPRSLPKRAHPARQAHQPLGPETASRPQAASAGSGRNARAESTPVSWRSQHPDASPATRRASTLITAHLQGSSNPAHNRRLRSSPFSRFRGVVGRSSRLNRRSHFGRPHTPQQRSPGRHPCQACTLSVRL